ncbi:MAG TPA: glycosyltransferase [Candidatus Angelobacter sp.]|nr:glycosyltransferase [Candidatus Angelobacter sp.]
MRAVLTNLGSMGDIQPLIALARELKENGHDPVLVLAPLFSSHAEQAGIEFSPIGWDLDYARLQRKDTEDALKGVDPVNSFRDSLSKLAAMLPQMLEELQRACHDADVLISGHLQPASLMLHELTDIPFVSVHMNHFGGKQPDIFRREAAGVINVFRARYGLPPITDPFHVDANSPQLALYAISRYLRPASEDWPPHYRVIGFFFLETAGSVPDPELAEFIAKGERPVVITFSSIAHPDPKATTALLLKAIEQAGCRAVIQQGWSGLAKNGALPERVLGASFIQHTSLFPQSACVVHAGGAGTTAAALRSGVPSVIVPHIGDQPLWAELVHGLGCAGGVVPFAELTAAKLATAVQKTLNDQRLYARAAEVGEKIRAEQGVSRARSLVERLVADCANASGQAGVFRAAARKTRQNRLRFKRSPLRAYGSERHEERKNP